MTQSTSGFYPKNSVVPPAVRLFIDSEREITCPTCDGECGESVYEGGYSNYDGAPNERWYSCERCGGSGYVWAKDVPVEVLADGTEWELTEDEYNEHPLHPDYIAEDS